MKSFPSDMKLEHFLPDEFNAPEKMDKDLLLLLDWIRNDSGVPIIITSDYRDPDHNRRIGGSPSSHHIHGRAVDFVTPGMRERDKRAAREEMYQILTALFTTHADNFHDRPIQLELVMSDKDWHYHIGLYTVDTTRKSNVVLALD
jgi:hypothetical protein